MLDLLDKKYRYITLIDTGEAAFRSYSQIRFIGEHSSAYWEARQLPLKVMYIGQIYL